MTKIQKCEWISLIGILLSVPVLFFASLSNLDLYGTKPTSPFEVISFLLFGGFALFFAVIYIIKIIHAVVKKTEKLLTILIWSLSPILIIIATAALVNGATPVYDEGLKVLNIFTTIGVVLTCILYNVYFFFFWGSKKHMYITLILFNIAAWIAAYLALGISYLHNYYLMMLIPALTIGYLEYYLRLRFKKKSLS